jgi:ABC-type transport system involved in multi-copper enzyme maturation permease subunit
MRKVLVIAADSVRALLHQRLLQALVLVSLALTVLFSIGLRAQRRAITGRYQDDSEMPSVTGTNKMTEKEQREMREAMDMAESGMQAAFYGVVSFGGTLVTLLIFCTAVASEIRKGTIRVTMSKPVTRTQFLLGRYCGGVAVMLGYWVLMTIAMLAFGETQQVALSPALKYAPWLMLCKHLMLGSVAILLSLFTRPILAAVLAYFISANLFHHPNPLYYVFPSYDRFSVFGEVFSGQLIAFKDVLMLSLYALDVIVIVLLLAFWRFRSKELV